MQRCGGRESERRERASNNIDDVDDNDEEKVSVPGATLTFKSLQVVGWGRRRVSNPRQVRIRLYVRAFSWPTVCVRSGDSHYQMLKARSHASDRLCACLPAHQYRLTHEPFVWDLWAGQLAATLSFSVYLDEYRVPS